MSDGLCECGCGQTTTIAAVTDRNKGWVKGRPLRFALGHNLRGRNGALSARWKGGRSLSSHGYVVLSIGSGRRQYEHVAIAEQTLGRKVRRNETVHHIDGDKANNARTNLLICTRAYHVALHARLEKSPDWPQFAVNPRSRGRDAK